MNANLLNLRPVEKKKKSKLSFSLGDILKRYENSSCRQKHPKQKEEKFTSEQFSTGMFNNPNDSDSEMISVPSPDEFSSNEQEIKNNEPKKKPKLMAEI